MKKQIAALLLLASAVLFNCNTVKASEEIPKKYYLNGQLTVGLDTLSTTDKNGNTHVWEGYYMSSAFQEENAYLLTKPGFLFGVKVEVDTNGTLSLEDDVPTIIDRNYFDGARYCYPNISDIVLTPTEIDMRNYTELNVSSIYLPDSVKNYLTENDWHILLTESSIFLNNVDVAGFARFGEKRIYINTNYGFYTPEETLYHEIGHVVYYMIIPGFDMNYLNELSNITFHGNGNSEYIVTQKMEAMAQFFYEYMFYPEELEAKAPNLYRIYRNSLK